MITVSASGADLRLDIVQGVQFVMDFFDADVNQQNPVDLSGYSFTFILRKKLGLHLSNVPADRIDWSSYVSVLATDAQLGNNHVARLSVPASQTTNLTPEAKYAYTITSTKSGASAEWFRGEAIVRSAL